MPEATATFAGAIPGRFLGRIPTPMERKEKCLPLRNFIKLSEAPVPASMDVFTKARNSLSQMMGNDQQGDCVAVTVAKKVGIDTAHVPQGKERVATTAEVLAWYHLVGGPGDNGMYIPDALDWAMRKGFTMGGRVHSIDGFAILDNTDRPLVDAAAFLLGGLHLGIDLPRAWYQEAGDNDVWGETNSPIIGGHSVPLTGFDQQHMKIATWAKQPRMTRAAFHSPRWVSECYAVLGKDWYNAAGLDANGVNVAALKAALETIRNGGTPDIPDDPNPPEPVDPPVPPTGAELLDMTGTLTLAGKTYPVNVVMSLVDSAGPDTAVNIWVLLADLAALTTAVLAKDWVKVAAAVAKLLADLGLNLSPNQRAQIIERLQRANASDGEHTLLKAVAAQIAKP